MLSNFALEQQLNTARQELSHALYQVILVFVFVAPLRRGGMHDQYIFIMYPCFIFLNHFPIVIFCLQHDSACRVIARLKKERDEARQLLSETERHIYLLPQKL